MTSGITKSPPIAGAPAPAVPIACTLGAREHEARLAEWRELKREGLTSVRCDGRVLTTVWAGPGVPARLEGLIEAEKQCCSFLSFDVEDDGDTVRVRVTAPEGAEALLTSYAVAQHQHSFSCG